VKRPPPGKNPWIDDDRRVYKSNIRTVAEERRKEQGNKPRWWNS